MLKEKLEQIALDVLEMRAETPKLIDRTIKYCDIVYLIAHFI